MNSIKSRIEQEITSNLYCTKYVHKCHLHTNEQNTCLQYTQVLGLESNEAWK